jgi:hypothetical protein
LVIRYVIISSISFIAGLGRAEPSITLSQPEPALSGVSVIGSMDAQFRPAIAELIPSADLVTYEPILPYSVVIKNNTQRPIMGVCVRFDIVDSTGHHTAMVQQSGYLRAKALIPPTGEVFVAIEGGYSLTAARSQLRMGLAHPLEFYNNARNINITLDSVLFTDGTLLGPDRQNTFARYTAQTQADKTLAEGVLTSQAGGLQALQQYLDSKATLLPVGDDFYAREISALARSWRALLTKHGPTAVVTAAAAVKNETDAFMIHR